VLFVSCLLIAKPQLALEPETAAATGSSEPPSVPVPSFTATPLIGGSVELIIKNQPFNYSSVLLYYQFNFSSPSVYYNIRIKDHNETNDWVELYNAENGFPEPSNLNYTVISIAVPLGAQTDIEVDAMIGVVTRVFNPNATNQIEMYPYEFDGLTSDWSNTETVTMPAGNYFATASPTASPFLTLSLTISFVVIAFLLAIIIALLLYMRKSNRLLGLKPKSGS
jgi:hypothetical protein